MYYRNVLMITMLFVSANVSAEQYRVAIGYDYLTGNYGTSSTTDIQAITLTGRYRQDKWTLQASIPYLSIKGTGITRDGLPVAGTARSEQGWGDLNLSTAYLAFYDKPSGLGVSGKFKIKIPTADESKGLGTGEADYAIQLDPFYVTGPITVFATIGYKMYGDTDTTDYQNVAYLSLGGMYQLNPNTQLGIGSNYREKVTDTADEKRELFAFVSSKLDQANTLQGHLSAGFSDSSPDWAAGFVLKHAY